MKTYPSSLQQTALAIAVGLMLASPVLASDNLLQNGNFNAALGGTWNIWTYGGGWSGGSTNPDEAYDGTPFVYMGGNDGGGGGLNQVLFAQPGVPYTLSSVSAVSAWWWPEAQMRLIFLDANDAELLLAATNCAAGITGFDLGLAWSNYTFTVTSPPGTAKVKAEFACYGHGTVRFENAVLTAPLVYPTIGNLSPDGSTLMQIASSFSFTAASTATAIEDTGIQLIMNGVDVSTNLVITGTSLSKNVSYSGITSNRTYTAAIQVTDAGGLITSRSVTFDTFSPAYYTWEAEDYDYSGGQYVDNPQTNAYYGLTGTPEVDFHAASNDNIQFQYRPLDLVGTEVTADALRVQYAVSNDFSVGWFDGGEWLNFTRNFPEGLYNIYARMASPGSSTLNLSKVTGGLGTTDQTTTQIGNFNLTGGLGWSSYSWVPLQDISGNMVKLTLGGVNTLRATSGGNANLQFFMLAPANTNLPAITALYPDGSTLFQATNTLRFTATSTAGINASSIQVTLNVTNAVLNFTTNLTSANGLTIGGTANSRTVSYAGLLPDTRYNAVITVTDINNNTISITPRFDTYNPTLVWEAEDWNYNGGQYIDNPGVNAYAGLAGVEGVDYHDINGTGGHPYRPLDTMAADVILDTPRAETLAAGGTNFAVGYFAGSEWINYTRSFPAGTYNVYGRFAAGGDTSFESLSTVANGETQPVGTFTIANTGGWGTYRWVPLRDSFGNLAQVALNGVTTLRAQHTSGADANNDLFMIIPAQTGLPTITQVTPIGWRQSTNKLRFVASSSAGISTNNIVVRLNNTVVTNVSFTGSATSWNGSSVLAPNTVYTAVITATDDNGLTATATVNFDTFSPAAYTWEAEDFDYGNGQFYDNPQVNSYFVLDAVEGVDMHDTVNGGDPIYRYTTLATGAGGDLARPQYDGVSLIDYYIGYTATGEWENYTRTYPTGTFNIYLRAARGTSGTGVMGLQKVTSGWGTANQTTANLGTFTVPNTGAWQTYEWVPLRDAGGNLVSVDLIGQATLRLTDGGANVNFFALAPAVALNAAAGVANMDLSFGTQSGFNYTVLQTEDLTTSAWTELISFPGDGTVKSTSTPRVGTSRFYRLEVH